MQAIYGLVLYRLGVSCIRYLAFIGLNRIPGVGLVSMRFRRYLSLALASSLLVYVTIGASGHGIYFIAYICSVIGFWHYGRGQCWGDRLAILHLIAVIPLLIDVVGICTTHCGQLGHYDDIWSVPTGLIGMIAHIVCAGLWFSGKTPMAVSIVVSGLTCGASLFFGWVLVAHGAFCAPCFSAHAVAYSILLVILSNGSWNSRSLVVGWSLAACGILGFIKHPVDLSLDLTNFDSFVAEVEDHQDLSSRHGLEKGFAQMP